MKIAFVTSETHCTGTGGGVTHTMGTLSLLDGIEGCAVQKIVLPLPGRALPHRLRQAAAMARSQMSPLPGKAHYLLGRGAWRGFRHAMATDPPDVVIFNGADLLPLAGMLLTQIKPVLLSHNVESAIAEQQAALIRGPMPLRRVAMRDSAKARAMEKAGARRMALILAISEDDAAWYRAEAPDTPVEVFSGAFAYRPCPGPRPPLTRPLRIALLAKMNWWPNREGAEWLVAEVLPRVASGLAEFHFFGPGTETFDGRLPNLHGHGFVDRLESVWEMAHFTLCPILSGSGLNIKIAESLYNRVPVLATPHGLRGFGPAPTSGMAVVEPDGWAEFLTSDRAMTLASATVLPEAGSLFSAARQRERIASLLKAL